MTVLNVFIEENMIFFRQWGRVRFTNQMQGINNEMACLNIDFENMKKSGLLVSERFILAKLEERFQQVLFDFNEKLNLNLEYIPTSNLMPSLPSTTDISVFTKWISKNTSKKLLFYYFILPTDNNNISNYPTIQTLEDHEEVILHLREFYPNYTILLPKHYSNATRVTNILSLEEDFHYIDEIEGQYEYGLAKIAGKCDMSIHFDVAEAMLFFNMDFPNTKNKIFHFSQASDIYKNFLSQLMKLDSNAINRYIDIPAFGKSAIIDYINTSAIT